MTKITLKLNITGTNAKEANRLIEFNIPPNKEAIDMNIKYGIVIRHNNIVKLSLSSKNPGAIINIKYGINICIKTTIIIKLINNIVKTSPENLRASLLDSSIFSLKIGIKALESAPSAKIRLNKLGSLNAILTLSATLLVPNNDAINNSLARPKIRDIKVKNATVTLDRNNMNCHIYEEK